VCRDAFCLQLSKAETENNKLRTERLSVEKELKSTIRELEIQNLELNRSRRSSV
jgi:hypothetical protein